MNTTGPRASGLSSGACVIRGLAENIRTKRHKKSNESMDLGATIAVVAGLQLLSVPVVLTVSPLLMGGHLESVNRTVWAGAGLVIAGSLLLVVAST